MYFYSTQQLRAIYCSWVAYMIFGSETMGPEVPLLASMETRKNKVKISVQNVYNIVEIARTLTLVPRCLQFHIGK